MLGWEEFEHIFDTVVVSGMVNDMQIPREISKEIAQFATGNLVRCCSTQCNELIGTLAADREITNDECQRKYGYGYESVDKQKSKCEDLYLCADCMRDVLTWWPML